jgi:histidinol dehydrogenase
MVYPVYSRRSRGLSVGINLFPDRKLCSFNCPYCEVFPFSTGIVFSPDVMKAALCSCLREAHEEGRPVRDICFSGNGEPTMSPDFPEALKTAKDIRDDLAPGAKLVLITNGTGLLDDSIFSLLAASAENRDVPPEKPPPAGRRQTPPETGLDIWLKLDAGTEDWYRKMDRPGIAFERLAGRIKAFAAAGAPFTIQTMVCRIHGALPPPEEEAAWLELVTALAVPSLPGAPLTGRQGLRAVQIYGKARPAPEDPLAEAAPKEVLERRAEALNGMLETAGSAARAEVY